ncbi:hypothetical protein [Microbacterium aquimaris]|uniref:Uncharacterized protein n=1 Tax=Microbacterium aquimaris TaxID=459816 RepID=A0ABU5N5L4_9MICO|nr:hypothetical protein [Microbacterium aquimaris]MDZ8161374.1 hypothetical protein [Microbacterium aquimaris]MDZ8274709.1 hypothetical protein [Microbacterium aquimaris]
MSQTSTSPARQEIPPRPPLPASARQAQPSARPAPPKPPRDAPERPALSHGDSPPVLTKAPPPFSVRLSQFLWVLSLAFGAVTIVFYFVIREDQLPLIIDAIKAVSEDRTDETYEAAADIVYWAVFAIIVTLVLMQIVLLVSFSSRKPGARWWQFATVMVQVVAFLIALELVGGGEYGSMLRQLFTGEAGFAVLALLLSTLRGALAWTARKHDVRRSGDSGEY